VPLSVSLAALLALAALLIPARGAAAALAGGDAAHLESVVLGMMLFKGMLLVHAAIILLARRAPLRGVAVEPLAADAVPAPGDVPSRRAARIIAAIVAVGLALRLTGLGAGLWYDEITALVKYARAPLGAILTTFDSQNQHLLYSLLAHGSIAIFGDSPWALRLPAALLGAASLWATYWFGVLVTSRREALLAAALLAVSYHHVWFSQNARGYSGLLLFTLVSSALLLRLLRARRAQGGATGSGVGGWRLALAYAAVSALGVFTNLTAVLVTAAHFLVWAWLLVRAHRRPIGLPRESRAAAWLPLAGFVIAATLTLQLYAPVLPQLLVTATTPTMAGVQTEWKNPLWFAAESLRGLSAGLPGGLVTLALGAAIGVTGLASYWRRGAAVVAVMLLPAVLTAAAMLATEHNLWPRLFFFCAGFAVLIAVRGVFVVAGLAGKRRAPVLATAALVLAAVGSAATLPRAWHPKQDFIAARDYVERSRAAGDAVVIVDLARFPYERWLATGWRPADSVVELEVVERAHARTWGVYTFPERLSATRPELWRRLRDSYTTAARFPGTVGGGAVVVLVRG
jgi:4-amino-4-deoxy-L-arabinose transferase-like glycosyltransferase